MSEKKPTVASLKQEIEQIKARLEERARNPFFLNKEIIELRAGEVLTWPPESIHRDETRGAVGYIPYGPGIYGQTVNCQCFSGGNCKHHAAPGPRNWFNQVKCIDLVRPADPRVKAGCALKCEYPKPPAPKPPPKTL